MKKYIPLLSLSITILLSASSLFAQTPVDSLPQPDSLTAAHVVAYREQIKPVPGGYAVRVADLPVSKEAKALDVLKYLPSLNVNNHSVKMDGRSSIKVYIDGRPMRMSGQALADYLSALPAGEIDRIEVQTLPTAEHSAAGNVGVIRLTRQKDPTVGIRGNLSGSLGLNSYLSEMGSAFLEYNGKKAFISGSFSADDLRNLRHKTYGPTYQYEPAVSREAYQESTLTTVVDKLFGGNSYLQVVSAFVKDEKITVEELKELIAKIENK